MVHLPSMTVFSNWPTDQTPLRKVTALEFNAGGDLLAIGNNKGKVILYSLRHFQTAKSGRF